MLVTILILVLYVIPILISYFGSRFLYKRGGDVGTDFSDMVMMFIPVFNWGLSAYVSAECTFLLLDKLMDFAYRVDNEERTRKIANSFFRIDKEED